MNLSKRIVLFVFSLLFISSVIPSVATTKELTPPFAQSNQDCLTGIDILPENRFSLFTEIHDSNEDLVCGHVEEDLRADERDPEKNNVDNIIRSCLFGVLKGFFTNLLDKATGFFDLARAVGKILGSVGKLGSKAFSIAKALYQGGVPLVMNEFFSSGGEGFFQTIRNTFKDLFNKIKDTVARAAFTVTHCYSPVAKSRLACQAVSYIGVEFFGGFLFSSLKTASVVASQAANLTRTQKILSGLTPFFKRLERADNFVNAFLPRKFKKILLKSTGLTDITVAMTKRYRKFRNRFNVLIGRYKRGQNSFTRFRGISKAGEQAFVRYHRVHESIIMKQELVASIQERLQDAAKMGDRILESDLRKELVSELIGLEKYYEQASQISQRLENLMALADTGSSLVRNGIRSQVFSDGVRF